MINVIFEKVEECIGKQERMYLENSVSLRDFYDCVEGFPECARIDGLFGY